MKIKTNREWLAENPERISGVKIMKALKDAFGNESRVSALDAAERLDKWLNAPHVEKAKESAVIFTLKVKKYYSGQPPLPEFLEKEAQRIADGIRRAGTAGASVEKIQVLVGDGK